MAIDFGSQFRSFGHNRASLFYDIAPWQPQMTVPYTENWNIQFGFSLIDFRSSVHTKWSTLIPSIGRRSGQRFLVKMSIASFIWSVEHVGLRATSANLRLCWSESFPGLSEHVEQNFFWASSYSVFWFIVHIRGLYCTVQKCHISGKKQWKNGYTHHSVRRKHKDNEKKKTIITGQWSSYRY